MRRINATEARVHLGDRLRRVTTGGESVIVERGGERPECEPRRATLRRALAVGDEIQRAPVGAGLPHAEDVIHAGRDDQGGGTRR